MLIRKKWVGFDGARTMTETMTRPPLYLGLHLNSILSLFKGQMENKYQVQNSWSSISQIRKKHVS